MKDKLIIFLDIDGVLCNCYQQQPTEFLPDGEHAFWPEAIKALNALIEYYCADIGMVSSWNNKFYTEDLYKTFLISRGIIVNDLFVLDSNKRSDSIIEFLKSNPEYNYLIIDDEAYGYYNTCFKQQLFEYKRICQPNMYRCLDMYDAIKYIKWNLSI